MRKTYENRGWTEIAETVELVRRLGLFGEARIAPVVEGVDPPPEHYNLTVEFDGFDAEPGGFAERRRIVAFDLADPEGGAVVGLEAIGETVRTIEIPQGAPPEGEPGDAAPAEPVETEPAPEEVPEPEIEVAPETDREPDPEPETPAITAEDTKVCKRCEKEKPLSAFRKHSSFKDNLDNRCRQCRAEMRRNGETSPKGSGASYNERRLKADATKKAEEEKIRSVTVLPPVGRVPELEEVARTPGPRPERAKKPERFCANGEDCMAVPHTGRPTKLNSGNKSDVCHGCEERATGRFGAGA